MKASSLGVKIVIEPLLLRVSERLAWARAAWNEFRPVELTVSAKEIGMVKNL